MPLAAKKTVVVDTNLFLHYKQLEHLNWGALECDDIELVVLPIVIRELEKQKALGSSPRLKKRAAEMVTWLAKLADNGNEVELKPGLRMKFETTEPLIDFEEHALVGNLQDDVLIAGLIGLAQMTPVRPVLATADLGVKLKARHRGFEVFAPLDTDKLADEPDARDKELQELRKENQQLKTRQPRLKIAFANGETRLNIRPVISNLPPAPATLDEIKQLHPLLESARNPTNTPPLHQLANVLNVVPESRRVSYNEKLQKYYEDYAKYRNQVERCRKAAQCRAKLQFVLLNQGTATATDIDVIFTFPEGTLVYKNLKNHTEPKAPTPPEMPIGGLMAASLLDASMFRSPGLPHFSHPASVISRQLEWSLDVTSNTAHFRLDRLKPEFDRELPPLWLQFPHEDAIVSTGVEVSVSAGESLGRVGHQLHLIAA